MLLSSGVNARRPVLAGLPQGTAAGVQRGSEAVDAHSGLTAAKPTVRAVHGGRSRTPAIGQVWKASCTTG